MESLDLALALPLPWQQETWSRVQRQREAGQLPHALLLAGPAGVGKRRFAQALAAGLLCLQPVDGVACGGCRACGLLAAGTHPDWTWLAPEEKGKAIKIDPVRVLVDAMAQTAQQGGRKLAVIEPAEAMNRNAANALLKTLEEPSGAALLILVSDSPARLLPTIRSRCQRLAFPLPPVAAARAWLEPIAGDAQRTELALRETGYRPLAARQLLEGEGLEQRQQLVAAIRAALDGGAPLLAVAERAQALDWDELLDWLQARVADHLRRRVQGGDAKTELDAALAPIAAARLFAWYDRIGDIHRHSRSGGNPNRQLALEALLLDLFDARHTPASGISHAMPW